MLETDEIQRGRQGACSKRANSDFPSRGWKILIGQLYEWCWQNMAEFGRLPRMRQIALENGKVAGDVLQHRHNRSP